MSIVNVTDTVIVTVVVAVVCVLVIVVVVVMVIITVTVTVNAGCQCQCQCHFRCDYYIYNIYIFAMSHDVQCYRKGKMRHTCTLPIC